MSGADGKTEPALVPEWLRCTGNIAGGASVHHSDTSSSAHSPRNRSFRSNDEKESSRFLQRSSSSNSSSSSNGSAKHPYSSFSRSHWDRNRERGKEKSIMEDFMLHETLNTMERIILRRLGGSALKGSQSSGSTKTGEPSPQRMENKPVSGNGIPSQQSNLDSSRKSVFEKDFPSLGTEDKLGVTGIRRASSPGLSSAVQSLPVGSSRLIRHVTWTSALAEAPATVGSNGTGHSPLQHNVSTSPNSSSGVCGTAGLNMAEALSKPAARVHAIPQLPDKSHRLEELAIKQSRQLIPVTPSLPKPLVPSAADKSKQSKIALRTNEMTVAPKAVHPLPHPSNHAVQSHSGQSRSDSASNPHAGKFLVLKPGRESVASGAKDVCCSTGNGNGKVAKYGQPPMASCSLTAAVSVNNSTVSAVENKSATLSPSSKSSTDKRSSQSLAQSRSEFFNLMRRKTSVRAPAVRSDSSLDDLSTGAEESAENCKKGHAAADGNRLVCNGDSNNITENAECLLDVGGSSLPRRGSIYPVEEETAFLRSLGWEENVEEDEGLTEEEINAFYQEYMNRRPSSSLDPCQSCHHKSPTSSKFSDAVSDPTSDSSSSELEP